MTLKKFALLGAASALGAAALLCSGKMSLAADHLDAPATQMAANAMADITDVYAWMSTDGSKVNLVMDVSPADDGTHHFGPSTLYVFHVTSRPGFLMSGTTQNVICKFASDTSVECWVANGSTTVDYVTGDPSVATGLANASGKIKMFAGRRSDPFFFNLGGFKTAVMTVEGAAAGITFNPAGCPVIDAATANVLRTQLVTPPAAQVGPCMAAQGDCFATFNVNSIVMQIDKTDLNVGSNTLLSVWGSTNMAM